MFYLLTRYHHRMLNELANFEYVNDEIRERSVELVQKLTKDMQDAFLARCSNELELIVGVFSSFLVSATRAFWTCPPGVGHLRPSLWPFC